MMNQEQVASLIFEQLEKDLNLKPFQVTLTTHFRKDLGMDSLEMIEFLETIGRECGLNSSRIGPNDIQVVGDLVRRLCES